ncbi:unnamed protein product [Trichobilharzia szidati]|nr:unnamed protein product [Trichobilharzia szidati]
MMSRETFPVMLITHCCYFLLLITVISLTDGFSRCDIKQSSQPESVNCPNKTCSQHIDCWVTYGPPQRCVCDPILCGSVCLPGISCGYIHEPTNGRIHYKYDQKFQSEATITCSEGYKVMCDTGFLLSTEDGIGCKRVCLENGSWSGEDVYCKVITCPEPQSILNGKHTVSSLTVNGTHISECDDGYELHGSHHRVCQLNGKWSGQEPYCKKRDCGPPPQIQNGEVSYITTTYGSKGRIICEDDTTLSIETDEIICGVNGTVTVWNPQPFPQCHRHCYLFTVEHGDVFLIHRRSKGDKQFIQITTAEFGNEDDDVGDDGEHRRLVNEMSGRIILPGGKVRHGSELNVTCQVGYALIKPNQPLTVCQNGVWSVRSKCAPGK